MQSWFKEIKSDLVIFCLGGASWSVTGSAGEWLSFFEEININIVPFQASNCSFKIEWAKEIVKTIEGKPLKNISNISTTMQRGIVAVERIFKVVEEPVAIKNKPSATTLENFNDTIKIENLFFLL